MDHDFDRWYAKKVEHRVVMRLMQIVKNAGPYFFCFRCQARSYFLPSLDMWNEHSEKHSLSTLLMQHNFLPAKKSACAIQLIIFTKSSCCYEIHFDMSYFYATHLLLNLRFIICVTLVRCLHSTSTWCH